jgi:tetratricopeptide (TPR) repeat protein
MNDKKQTITDCARMSDEELVRVLALDKDDYTEGSLQLVAREMARRKIDLAQFINQVKMASDAAVEPGICTIDAALAALKPERSHWAGWRFQNCLRETIDVQTEAAFWTIHFFTGEGYWQSFVIKNFKDVEAFVARFLRLCGKSYMVDFQYHLDDCETLIESFSFEYLANLSKLLGAADIPHTVRAGTRTFFNAISGWKHEADTGQILIPSEYKDAAKEVLAGIADKIQALREEIVGLEENNASDAELLERYDQLAQLVESNPEISCNRGILLFALGRNEEAAQAFIDAAHDGMAAQGNLPTAEFEEHWQTTESHLERLAGAMPENLGILHCLANMAMFEKNDDKAKARYEKILAVAPSDSIAHLNLGNLYYQDPHDHARAARHFRSYLENQPKAEDRAAIEEILANL